MMYNFSVFFFLMLLGFFFLVFFVFFFMKMEVMFLLLYLEIFFIILILMILLLSLNSWFGIILMTVSACEGVLSLTFVLLLNMNESSSFFF